MGNAEIDIEIEIVATGAYRIAGPIWGIIVSCCEYSKMRAERVKLSKLISLLQFNLFEFPHVPHANEFISHAGCLRACVSPSFRVFSVFSLRFLGLGLAEGPGPYALSCGWFSQGKAPELGHSRKTGPPKSKTKIKKRKQTVMREWGEWVYSLPVFFLNIKLSLNSYFTADWGGKCSWKSSKQ